MLQPVPNIPGWRASTAALREDVKLSERRMIGKTQGVTCGLVASMWLPGPFLDSCGSLPSTKPQVVFGRNGGHSANGNESHD